jgi:hypothetical protein
MGERAVRVTMLVALVVILLGLGALLALGAVAYGLSADGADQDNDVSVPAPAEHSGYEPAGPTLDPGLYTDERNVP